jgi:hypothetical protein
VTKADRYTTDHPRGNSKARFCSHGRRPRRAPWQLTHWPQTNGFEESWPQSCTAATGSSQRHSKEKACARKQAQPGELAKRYSLSESHLKHKKEKINEEQIACKETMERYCMIQASRSRVVWCGVFLSISLFLFSGPRVCEEGAQVMLHASLVLLACTYAFPLHCLR